MKAALLVLSYRKGRCMNDASNNGIAPSNPGQNGQSMQPANQAIQPSQDAQGTQGAQHATYNAQPVTTPYAPPSGQPVSPQGSSDSHVGAYPHEAAHAAKRPSSGLTFLFGFLGAAVACVLAFAIIFASGVLAPKSTTPQLGAASQSSIESEDVEATLAEAVADKCLPSVVSIDVYATQSQSSGNSIYDYLYGYGGSGSGELAETGLGSGVILTEDGYIVTNNHVVDGGEQFQVTIEGEVYSAELVGAEASSDIAVLKVTDGSGFTPMAVGDSDAINIGEWVMSIGSPFGLEQSVATGIVSATSRSQIMDADSYSTSGEITIYPNMIQTDAAINPGNSGGALVNANGELIGINTLISSYSGNYSGVGFAIPSNYAISLAESIIAGEEPTHASLGVTMTTVSPSIAERYGFSADEGAYVSSVVPGSAAEQAGIKVGDIITAFDGRTVASSSDLMLDVRTKEPGDQVTITVNRDGEKLDLVATLGTSTGNTISSSNTPSNPSGNSSDNGSRGNSGNGSNGNGSNGNSGNGGSGGSGNSLNDLLDLFNR